ncbi:MAG: ribonuclease H-like domain-containing protein [Candidatus Absconditicoccaceae bacterium]
MYKRFGLNDIKNIQNDFLQHFLNIIKKEKNLNLGDFLKRIFKQGDDIYYFERGEPIFRVSQNQGQLILIDEKDRIELKLSNEDKSELNNMLKIAITKKHKNGSQKSIESILLEEFRNGKYGEIFGKPYIVYDIETTSDTNDVKQFKFLIGYCMQPQKDNTMSYEYIDKEHLGKFVKRLLEFDGYIVGFNNIGFDNPVCIYNVGLGQQEIDILNSKTIDIFMFIRNLTGKRLKLNKVSETFIGSGKTVESGLEAEKLWKQYEETGDKKYLEEYKKYCKNDVRITALSLLYLLHFKKIFIEGDEILFETKDIIDKSKFRGEEIRTNNTQNQSIFE